MLRMAQLSKCYQQQTTFSGKELNSRLRLLLHVRIPTKAQTDRRIRAASTIIDILTLMSMINYMVSCVEHEKNFVISGPSDFSAKVLRCLFRS